MFQSLHSFNEYEDYSFKKRNIDQNCIRLSIYTTNKLLSIYCGNNNRNYNKIYYVTLNCKQFDLTTCK